ncbi:MAG: glycoside hydrolase family 99-like domain-containing protein [Betaproteobacteria bacterium]
MRVLFYIEPLTEREAPTWKRGWLDHVAHMVLGIRSVRRDSRFCAVVGDGLAAEARSVLAGSTVAVLRHAELVPRFGATAVAVATSWYRGASTESLKAMAALVKERVGRFVPEACISLSPAPFLREAFPGAVVLHFELGMVSRPPFPMTGYLDPLGMFTEGFLRRNEARVRAFRPSSDEADLVRHVRATVLPQIALTTGLTGLLRELAQGYRKKVLLALQFSNFYAYDAHATFAEQYDLLVQTLEAVPRDVGVFAVEHPLHPLFDEATFAHLRTQYPNLLWTPALRDVPAASQYVMEHVDAVVTVSSSVGWQALLWRKPLVVVGHSHLDIVADSNTLADLPALIEPSDGPDERKERLLAWQLTRYSSPFEALFGRGEIVARIERAMKLSRSGRMEEYYDQPFTPVAELTAMYDAAVTAGIDASLPVPRVGGVELIVATLYFGTEAAEIRYSEADAARNRFVADGRFRRIVFDVAARDTGLASLRLDPADRICFIDLRAIEVCASSGEEWCWRTGNGAPLWTDVLGLTEDGAQQETDALRILCLDDDPQMTLAVPEATLSALAAGGGTFSVELRAHRFVEAERVLVSDIGRAIGAAVAKLSGKEDALLGPLGEVLGASQSALNDLRQILERHEAEQAESQQREADRIEAWRNVKKLQAEVARLQAEHADRLEAVFAEHRLREDDRLAAWKAAEGLRVALGLKDELIARLQMEAEHAERLESMFIESAALAKRLDDVLVQWGLARSEADVRGAELERTVAQLRAARAEAEGLKAQVERTVAELLSTRTRAASAQAQAQSHRLRADAGEAQLRALQQSRSWRVTAPLRGAAAQMRNMRAAARRSAAQSARWLWCRLPLDRTGRDALKARLFPLIRPLIGNTGVYRCWIEYNATRAAIATAPRSASIDSASLAQKLAVGTLTQSGLPPLPEPVPVPLCTAPPSTPLPVTAVAFYLPQFHPIPENDAWWGSGFTEWTNVTRAKPQFVGHYQPHVPGELGYYDLRVPEVQQRQVELARLYGVGAFCFYFYWFAGHRLLERPVLQYLHNPALDLPFCLCWANENWSRRWDGLDQELLISQKHSPEDDLAFIEYLAKYLRDPRYLRVAGRPLVLVYRPNLLPEPAQTAQRWRAWCRTHGIGEIFLAYTQSFAAVDPAEYGFDAAIEFPPNNSGPPDITNRIERINPDFSGVVYDWRVFVDRSRNYQPPGYRLYRGVTPSWDNEARRTGRGAVLYGSTPEGFREWVRNAARDTIARFPQRDERLVFVNAWNEWAEGAHLEPDRRYGYAWLQAVRDGLAEAAALPPSATEAPSVCSAPLIPDGRSAVPVPATSDRRVVIVSHDAHPHGAQYLALHLAQVFAGSLGCKVDLVVFGDGVLKKDFAAYATVHDLAGIDPEGACARALADELFHSGARAALCNTTVSGVFLATLKRAGLRCVSLVHEMPFVMRTHGLARHAQLIAEHADDVVFPAQLVADGFAEFAAVPPERRHIRPQGLYKRNRFRGTAGQAAARSALRQQLGLPPDALVVLGVGYADWRKGIDLFVAAGQRLLPRMAEAYFVWIGHHNLQLWPQIEAQIAAGPAAERFLFPGRQTDTDAFYAGADVFALTSREDPFPSVVMESLEVGVPAVAFGGTGGCCDMIAAGAGLLVPAFDTDALAAATERLLREPALARQCGRWGAQRVQEDFSFRGYAFDLARWLQLPLHHVSVVVPNFNYARYLPERLGSIARQTYPVFEVIVLDDASTDGSRGILDELLTDFPFDARLVVNERNSGSVFKQWGKGAELARGDLIWIAEADDLADPEFLATVAAAFDDPEVVLSFCQSRQMASDGTILCEHYLDYVADISADKWRHDYGASGAEEIVTALAVKNTIPNVSAVVFRASVLREALEASAASLANFKVAGDWRLYIDVLRRGKIAFSAASLNSHRRHDSSVTLSSFNAGQLGEILRMQRLVREWFPVPESIRFAAGTYAQALYERFGLASAEVPHFEQHPELRSAA